MRFNDKIRIRGMNALDVVKLKTGSHICVKVRASRFVDELISNMMGLVVMTGVARIVYIIGECTFL